MPDLLDSYIQSQEAPPVASTAASSAPSGDLLDQYIQRSAPATQAADGTPSSSPVWSASVLPMSEDSGGNYHFDSNAGVLGSLKRAFTLPEEAMTGQVDPLSDEGIQRSLELATIASPVNPGITAGERAVPGILNNMVRAPVATPTSDALRAAANSGYDQARNMGVQYSSDSVANMANAVGSDLEAKGVIPEVAPKSFSVLGKLQNPPADSSAPLSGLDAARSAFGNIAKDSQGSRDGLAATQIKNAIDDFVGTADPSTVVAGPASAAADVLKDARGNYAAASRSDSLQGIGDAAELRASVSNSGQNLDNSIRQRAASLLQKPKDSYGYSDAELDAIKQVAAGSPARNALRYVGNLLGGGGGLGAMATGAVGGFAGGSVGGPILGGALGVLPPVVGMMAKKAGNSLTSKSLAMADELVRQRSPLFNQTTAAAPFVTQSSANNAALAKALMLNQQNQSPGNGYMSLLANGLINPQT